MSDSGIQVKRRLTAPPGFGFDDEGNRVPIVLAVPPDDPADLVECSDVDAARIRREMIVRFITRLLEAGDAKEIGRRVLVIANLLKGTLPGAPQNLDELGRRMGVSKSRASQIVSKLNPYPSDLSGLFD